MRPPIAPGMERQHFLSRTLKRLLRRRRDMTDGTMIITSSMYAANEHGVCASAKRVPFKML